MSLIEIQGDLFAVPDLDALAHGVNTIGVMGAGIAVRFRDEWPAMFREYERACRTGDLRPGDRHAWLDIFSSRWIYNLATQPRPGRCARVAHVASAVSRMVAHARAAGVRRIGLPRIGCGYGGLDYRDVRPVLLAAADDLDLVVVERKR